MSDGYLYNLGHRKKEELSSATHAGILTICVPPARGSGLTPIGRYHEYKLWLKQNMP